MQNTKILRRVRIVVAILGTSMASVATWAADFGLLLYPESAVLWYIWPVIYAAYVYC
ncbi:MAG: hypothetical protein ACLQVG_16440 [Terriglobia bacterium]